MPAYYNEIDPFAAQWLRNLIAQGHIAPGDVDTRSIEDVRPSDLDGFIQCHFFAGIGVWSHALRQAGWPDDKEIWTGSCPCQSFSIAGKGDGFADKRHLWPSFFHLIEQCRPATVFGEQVEAAIRYSWLDLVQTDLENSGYAFAAAGINSAGFGAPHIRQRLYFVAHAERRPTERQRLNMAGSKSSVQREAREQRIRSDLGDGVNLGSLAHHHHQRSQGWSGMSERAAELVAGQSGVVGGMDDSISVGWGTGRDDDTQHVGQQLDTAIDFGAPMPTNGFWREADWIGCRDGKWRPVEPATFPLAPRSTGHVGRLRGYGNAITAPVAQNFIESFMGVM